MKRSSYLAFSLIEVMVAMFIGVLVVEAAYLFFPLGNKIAREGEVLDEITQDARIVLNRLKRELRQSPLIITILPADQDSGVDLIELEDGFPEDTDVTPHYIRYSRTDGVIIRTKLHYENESSPGTVVTYDDPSATEIVEHTEDIAANAEELKIYSLNNLIKIYIKMSKRDQDIALISTTFPRSSAL
jgi:hypothetical protein